MRIGLLASNAALAEYFVTALGMADHAVTLYPAVQDLFSALARRYIAARGSATRGPAPRADPGREWEKDTCRAKWSYEGPGTSHHCPHHRGPGRHRPGTSCVPGSVPEAVATSAQGPARFDAGATPIGVVCHAVVLRVGKSILLALACSFHSEIRLLLRSVSAV